MDVITKILATGLGTGYIPVAPGTMGSIVGVAVWWGLSAMPHHIYIPTVIAFIFLATWISSKACVIFADSDPSKVNIDEIAGILVTFAFHDFTWLTAAIGFVLFRIFDISKPPPIRWIEKKFPAGWGVVLDDVVAGVYANAVLWFVFFAMRYYVK